MTQISAQSGSLEGPRFWWALIGTCMGFMMASLEGTMIVIALPSITTEVGTATAEQILAVELLSCSAVLLLVGRLSDLFGSTRFFVFGVIILTASSAVCGFTSVPAVLIGARAVEGIGTAIVSVTGLSLITNMSQDPARRAKAIGGITLVASVSQALGWLLGGELITALNWHWIFLVNIPIGIAACILCVLFMPWSPGQRKALAHFDFVGALFLTGALIFLNYIFVTGSHDSWRAFPSTTALLGTAVMVTLFLYAESRAREPLIPLAIFRRVNFMAATSAGVLYTMAMYAVFLTCPPYLQLVLGKTPLQVAVILLPYDIVVALFSLGISAKLIVRFGFKTALVFGLSLVAAALILLTRAPVSGSVVTNVLPSLLLLGVGSTVATGAVFLAATANIGAEESGLASGILFTLRTLGGSLGVAALFQISSGRASAVTAAGGSKVAALVSGYHLAALAGVVFAILAATIGGLFLRAESQTRRGRENTNTAAPAAAPDAMKNAV